MLLLHCIGKMAELAKYTEIHWRLSTDAIRYSTSDVCLLAVYANPLRRHSRRRSGRFEGGHHISLSGPRSLYYLLRRRNTARQGIVSTLSSLKAKIHYTPVSP